MKFLSLDWEDSLEEEMAIHTNKMSLDSLRQWGIHKANISERNCYHPTESPAFPNMFNTFLIIPSDDCIYHIQR